MYPTMGQESQFFTHAGFSTGFDRFLVIRVCGACWSLQTTILCIVRELAGGRYVTVAVAIVTGDK